MKKMYFITGIIGITLITFLLQNYLIADRTLFGVKPNLILILIVVLSLWMSVKTTTVVSALIGFLADIVYGNVNFIHTTAFIIIAVTVSYVSGNYRRQNKFTLLFITFMATILYGLIEYFVFLFQIENIPNFFYIFYQSIIAAIFHIAILYVINGVASKIFSKKKDKPDWMVDV